MTLIEVAVVSTIAFVVLFGAGLLFLTAEKGFREGSRKMAAQQEATILATSVNRIVRVGDRFEIYVVPSRGTPADSGDGVAVLAEDGTLIDRLEWDGAQQSLVRGDGSRLSFIKLTDLKFRTDPARPNALVYRFAADDERGNLVEIETSVATRN